MYYICTNRKNNKKLIAQYLQYNEQLVTAVLRRDKHKLADILKKIWQQSLKTIELALKL